MALTITPKKRGEGHLLGHKIVDIIGNLIAKPIAMETQIDQSKCM